jgi:hypothetical protein
MNERHWNNDPVTGHYDTEAINPEIAENLRALKKVNLKPALQAAIVLPLLASACEYDGDIPYTDIYATETQPKTTQTSEDFSVSTYLEEKIFEVADVGMGELEQTREVRTGSLTDKKVAVKPSAYRQDLPRPDGFLVRGIDDLSLYQTESSQVPEVLDLTITPPSLMLHSKDLGQLRDLIPLLQKQGYNTTTYSEYHQKTLEEEKIENPLLVSIDDLNASWLRSEFRQMIELMRQHGMVGTLGINTPGSREEAREEVWQYLKELADEGWELAIHTEDHYNLPLLDDKQLRYQIEETYQEILEATEVRPITLILPFGSINKPGTDEHDERIYDICRELGILYIVGIPQGKSFEGEPPFFVGRIPPAKIAPTTINWLNSSFGEDK